MKNHLFVIIYFFSLISCENPNLNHESDIATKEIETFIIDYYSVMTSRNWTAYRDFFSDKASLTSIWQESTETNAQIFSNTISDFISQTANGPDSQPIFEEKPIDIEIEIKENLAAVWVKYEAKFGSDNELIEWKGYDLFSLIRFENQWKIISLAYTEISE